MQFPAVNALSLKPGDIVVLLRLAGCGAWIVEYLALSVLQTGRSSVAEVHGSHTKWVCSQVKSQVKKRPAPPFRWVTLMVAWDKPDELAHETIEMGRSSSRRVAVSARAIRPA